VNENELTAKFEKICKNDKRFEFLHRETKQNPPNPHMDLEFIYYNVYVRAEAKYTVDSRNKSQNALSAFGSIIKGRSLSLADIKKSKEREVIYALTIDKETVSDYKNRYKKLLLKDWVQFGCLFDVMYVFIVSNDEINIVSWTNFYNN